MKTEAQRAKKVKNLIRYVETWFTPNMIELYKTREHDPKRGIQKWLRSGSPRAAVVAAGDLWALTGWYAQTGVRAILAGDVQGWADLEKVLTYHWWNIRIAGYGSIYDASAAAAHAVIFGEERMAEWMIQKMVRASYDKSLHNSWYAYSFPPFLIQLWAVRKGIAAPELGPIENAGPGVYRRVLEAWNDPVALAPALFHACDYHLEQTIDRGDSTKEFHFPPYNILPVDILAIIRVRDLLGLPTPEMDHPLMQTPVAKPPPIDELPKHPQDALLEAVIAKARQQGFLPPPGGDDFAV